MNDELERISSLISICDYIKPNSIMIEIGCLRGVSTLIFRSSGKFREINCIDPWIGSYDNNDVNSHIDFYEVEKTFDENTSKYSDIIKIKSTSLEASIEWDKIVDFVYIDACHTYEAVKQDIDIWLPHIKPGGLIAGHDYGHHTNWTEFPGIKKAVDEMFGKPDMVLPDTSWVKFLR